MLHKLSITWINGRMESQNTHFHTHKHRCCSSHTQYITCASLYMWKRTHIRTHSQQCDALRVRPLKWQPRDLQTQCCPLCVFEPVTFTVMFCLCVCVCVCVHVVVSGKFWWFYSGWLICTGKFCTDNSLPLMGACRFVDLRKENLQLCCV